VIRTAFFGSTTIFPRLAWSSAPRRNPSAEKITARLFAEPQKRLSVVEPEKRVFAANVYLQDELRGVNKVHAAFRV
jgi:hypothetical protein